MLFGMRGFSFSWQKIGLIAEATSGVVGCVALLYGGYVLMVERASVPVCSLDLLNQQEDILRAQQPQLTVEVTGAVKNTGVWQFQRGQRIGEAIEKAGGFSAQADLEFIAKNLNLAEELTEGQKVYIPFLQENQGTKSSLGSQVTQNSSSGSVSINTASSEQLQTLSGVGETRAESIIQNRPYTSLNELVERKVLSASLLEDLKGSLQL